MSSQGSLKSRGLRAVEESQPPASHPQVRLEQPPGPDALAAPMQGTGVGVSEQHLSRSQSEVQPPDFTTKSGWKRSGPGLAGRVAPLLSVTAAPQRACGQGCKRLHPTQACRRQQEPPQEPDKSRGLLTAAGWLLSTAPTPRKHHPQQCTAWVTLGRATATALAQFFPSEQAGWVSSWQSVCAHLTL